MSKRTTLFVDLFFFVFLGVTIIGGAIYFTWSETRRGPAEIPIFFAGQMVKMKAFGTQGMIISVSCPASRGDHHYQCTYGVRFSAIQMRTDTHVFGADGPIDLAPIATVYGIRGYELEVVR